MQLSKELQQEKADTTRQLREAHDMVEQQHQRNLQAGAQMSEVSSKLQEEMRIRGVLRQGR